MQEKQVKVPMVTKREVHLALLRATLTIRIVNLMVQLVALDLPQDESFPKRLEEKKKKLETRLPEFFDEVLN